MKLSLVANAFISALYEGSERVRLRPSLGNLKSINSLYLVLKYPLLNTKIYTINQLHKPNLHGPQLFNFWKFQRVDQDIRNLKSIGYTYISYIYKEYNMLEQYEYSVDMAIST